MSNTQDNYISKAAINAANSSQGNRKQTSVPTRSDGTVGIRATLNNMGINNSLIGYDEINKTVTLGGKTLMKPTYIDEDAGISYAAPAEIQKNLVSYYSSSNNPIVKVTDAYANYAGQYGLSADALNYGNGTVTLGGVPLDILYVDDEGKSWAFQDNVQNSVNSYINSLGVSSPNDVLDYYNRRYLTPINSLANSIRNRSDFTYDPESDPVYQAYKNQYLTQGARASENAMANYAALTGGYANSAAATAAAQTQQYYMTQLTNQIPALAQAAYERYADKYNTDIELLGNMIDYYDTAYNNAYNANNKTINNINSSFSSNTERDNNAFQKYWERLFNQQTAESNEQDYYWTNLQNNQDYQWTDLLNTQKSNQNLVDIESSKLDNTQKQIYLKYYNDILQAQLNGSNLNNRLTEEKINQLILQNMYGI